MFKLCNACYLCMFVFKTPLSSLKLVGQIQRTNTEDMTCVPLMFPKVVWAHYLLFHGKMNISIRCVRSSLPTKPCFLLRQLWRYLDKGQIWNRLLLVFLSLHYSNGLVIGPIRTWHEYMFWIFQSQTGNRKIHPRSQKLHHTQRWSGSHADTFFLQPNLRTTQ